VTQAQLIVLLSKVVLISGFCSLALWIIIYSLLAEWWHDPIGQTLVSKSALLAGLFAVSILSVFFHLNPYIIAWADLSLITLVTPVMLWRSAVWVNVAPHRGTIKAEGAAVMGKVTAWVSAHRKAISGYLGALGGIPVIITQHQKMGSVATWAGIAVMLLGAIGVHAVPNAMK